MQRHATIASVLAMCIMCSYAGPTRGQVAPEPARHVPLEIDSGPLFNPSDAASVLYSTVVSSPGAASIRLRFGGVTLAAGPAGEGASLRLTGLADGAVQRLGDEQVRQWRHTSAYFNGDAVLVELMAPAGAGPSRVQITGMTVPDDGPMPHSLCGVDDRVLSSDPRMGRAEPVGCTAWLFDDCNKCFYTAGHCTDFSGTAMEIVEFNVPLSSASGAKQHPPPEHQYAVDRASIQFQASGTGADWAYFGCFPNSNSGLYPDVAQGGYFDTTFPPPAVSGQTFRVTGYGTVSSPVSPTWNQVQTTHTAPYSSLSGTTLRYLVDTTGGNSGSPVIDETNGRAVAIHTHAGCSTGGNHGTSLSHSGLATARATPGGVCIPTLDFKFLSGFPSVLNPAGGTVIQLNMRPRGCNEPQPDTAVIHYDLGAGFIAAPMTQVAANDYEFVFPGGTCTATAKFYFTALAMTGVEYQFPAAGAASPLLAAFADNAVPVFDDDFEIDRGWTVQNVNLADGAWVRGVPAGNGGAGDPVVDYDGSGRCYVTDNATTSSDVDGGPTRLVSPRWDLSGMTDPRLSYARWFSKINPNPPPAPAQDTDSLDVELSSNDGASWVLVERITQSTMWVHQTIEVSDYVALTAQVRVRFSVTDSPNNSTTEAGVDAVSIVDYPCNPPLVCMKADVNNDGLRDGRDIPHFANALIATPAPGTVEFCASDMDSNGELTQPADLQLFVSCILDEVCP